MMYQFREAFHSAFTDELLHFCLGGYTRAAQIQLGGSLALLFLLGLARNGFVTDMKMSLAIGKMMVFVIQWKDL